MSPLLILLLLGGAAIAIGSVSKKSSGASTGASARTILARGTGRSEHLGLVDFEIIKLGKSGYTARWFIRGIQEQGVLDTMSTDSAAFLEMSATLQLVSSPPFDTVSQGDGFSGGWGTTVHWELTRDIDGLWGWNAKRTGELAMAAGRYPYLWLPMFETEAEARASLQVEMQLLELGSGPTAPPPASGLRPSGDGLHSPLPGPTGPPLLEQPGPAPGLPPPLFSVKRYPNTFGVKLPPMTRSDGVVFSDDCRVAGVGPMFWERLGESVEVMFGQGFEFDDIMAELDEAIFVSHGINFETCHGPRLLRREIIERLTNFIQASTP